MQLHADLSAAAHAGGRQGPLHQHTGCTAAADAAIAAAARKLPMQPACAGAQVQLLRCMLPVRAAKQRLPAGGADLAVQLDCALHRQHHRRRDGAAREAKAAGMGVIRQQGAAAAAGTEGSSRATLVCNLT